MKQFLIIPDRSRINESLELAEKYNAGFEYNDFFYPEVLDSEALVNEIIAEYRRLPLPSYCTLHGAFFDVTVFSSDKKIREISDLRVRQSIEAARRIGAAAVVFHTNYNPFLNSDSYIKGWLDTNTDYWSGILDENPDIDIYIENMFDTSPYIMAALAERLAGPKNFGLCFDCAHAALTDVPQAEWATALGRYVRHVHINDNDLKSDLHLAVGDGRIDFNEFYRLYGQYMNGATVLTETSALSNQKRSFERLSSDGFLE